MAFKKRMRSLLALLMIGAICAPPSYACTIVAVGKKATVDGSSIVTHNDDSTTANF